MSALLRAEVPALSARAPRSPGATRHTKPSTSAPKLRYIVGVLLGIFAILAVQLMLSIAVSGGAYEIASLKGEMRQTEQKRQMVAEDISALVAPDTLAGLAQSLGMVTDNNPAYLRLSDSQVVGEAIPAPATNGALLYAVTNGTETLTPPAIVAVVFDSVSAAQGLELSAEDAVARESVAHASAVSPAAATASMSVQALEPAVRFGGTIPSPTTR